MIRLHDFQQQAVDKIWLDLFKKQSVLCVLPCGAGKTVIFISLIKKIIELKKDAKIVILLNKIDLLKQTCERIQSFLPSAKVSVFCGSLSKKDLSGQIVVGSIQSIHDIDTEFFNICIIDEVHRLNVEEGQYINFIEKCKNNNSKFKIIGFTATPFCKNGYIYGKDKLFEDISYKKSLQFMIDRGFLVSPILKCPKHQFDVSKLEIRLGEYKQEQVELLTSDLKLAHYQVADALERAANRKKIVWFCSCIKHAELIHSILLSHNESASIIHSQQGKEAREFNKLSFENMSLTPTRHLCFVNTVSEGYDYAPIDCVAFVRPTRSATLYVQVCGRGLRTYEGKTDCLILDYGKVVESLGPLNDPLVNDSKKSKKKQDVKLRSCPQCETYLMPATKKCPYCGYDFPVKINNQSDKAATNGVIIGEREITKDVVSVELDEHRSKKGNYCLRIDYIEFGKMMIFTTSEYFSWGHPFSKERAKFRLKQLGVNYSDNMHEIINQKILFTPKQIKVKYENNFPRVTKLIFQKEQEK